MAGKSDRCWTGYEPVPGKEPYEKGSCRKEPVSKAKKKAEPKQVAGKRESSRSKK